MVKARTPLLVLLVGASLGLAGCNGSADTAETTTASPSPVVSVNSQPMAAAYVAALDSAVASAYPEFVQDAFPGLWVGSGRRRKGRM